VCLQQQKYNPTIRQVCNAVSTLGFSDNANSRNAREAANHTANTTIGAPAAIATASPIRSESFRNKCSAEASKANTNHAPISHPVTFP